MIQQQSLVHRLDNFKLHKRLAALWLVLGLALLAACAGERQTTTPGNNANTGGAAKEVTIYVSTDRVFSEPVLRAYEQKTGVKVNAVYDTEETKSTGLANKLLAEKNRPQADVFWSNEPVRTLVLKKNGVLAPYKSPSAEGIPATFQDPENYWTGFSARSRVIVYNTNLVKPEEAPKSIFDLAEPKWKGQVAIADPRFGSTSFHVAALYAELGDERADDFFRRLKVNAVKIVPGNSVVRDMVARGEVKVGLTDTDDVNVALEDKQPVAMVFPDREGIGVPVMPNMVSLIAHAPHPEAGKKLIDHLLSLEVERSLAQSEAVQIPLHSGVEGPKNIPALTSFKPMTVDYGKAADRVEDVTRRLQLILGL
ncbi:MAG: extracellular solute-binding protein [Pyrinomonadaceae bacterium]|nr:extracellular solute-binding protein [Pyrinomonadaceae bacterium]